MIDVLEESDLDCSGVCTPARRYRKALVYQWEMECKLRLAVDGRCGDYINLYCFGDMKVIIIIIIIIIWLSAVIRQ